MKNEPVSVFDRPVVIVGAGVTGLSIAHLLTEHYGLRKDEHITVTTTVIRHEDERTTGHVVLSNN